MITIKDYYKIKDIYPRQINVGGWLHDFLEMQKNGLPGNLHKIGYPFNKPCWRSRTMTDGGKHEWWPYEQSAYWVDSMVRTAAILHDSSALDMVLEQIEGSILPDGEPFMGPVELKGSDDKRSRWPHAVFFRALWAMYLYTEDEKYLLRMREHYLDDSNTYSETRAVANAEIMYRLAKHFNDSSLLRKANRAIKLFSETDEPTSLSAAFSDSMYHCHGVTINEDIKMGAIAYLYTGNRNYLDASINAHEKLASFYMLPDGLHSCYEYATGNESFKAHESCDLTDYTYGLSFLLKTTGNGKYADRIERVIFNALPGSIGPEYKSIQYFSGVNQVIVGRNCSWLSMWENSPKMTYQAHHYPECCIANIGRALPNFCLNMYGETKNGLAVNLYSESSFKGENMSITVHTAYPFEEELRFTVDKADEKKNLLSLRIPGWSKGYDLFVNGKSRHCDIINGYISFRVKAGDKINLRFRFALVPSHSSDGGIWYSYGPLTMALKLSEKWIRDEKEPRQTDEFPAWNVQTDSPFAFALSGYECGEAKISWKNPGRNPFFDGSCPIEILLPAKKLNGWTYTYKKNTLQLKDNDPNGANREGIDAREITCGATQVNDDLQQTPRIPSAEFVKSHLGEDCEITLVPYGCTCLRLTVFPKYDFDS